MIPAVIPPWGIEIVPAPGLLRDSRQFIALERSMVVWSFEVLDLIVAQQNFLLRFKLWLGEKPYFPAWHDDVQNCSTWTEAGGCRCEVEP